MEKSENYQYTLKMLCSEDMQIAVSNDYSAITINGRWVALDTLKKLIEKIKSDIAQEFKENVKRKLIISMLEGKEEDILNMAIKILNGTHFAALYQN